MKQESTSLATWVSGGARVASRCLRFTFVGPLYIGLGAKCSRPALGSRLTGKLDAGHRVELIDSSSLLLDPRSITVLPLYLHVPLDRNYTTARALRLPNHIRGRACRAMHLVD